jgi:hypothetical protein
MTNAKPHLIEVAASHQRTQRAAAHPSRMHEIPRSFPAFQFALSSLGKGLIDALADFYWDAAIIEAARAAGCHHEVLSEDLNAGQDYGGIQGVNPFA